MPIETLEDFRFDLTVNPHKRKTLPSWSLETQPRVNGPLLAALGRMDEARSILMAWVTENEVLGHEEIAAAEAELARRANSRTGKQQLRWGRGRLEAVARLRGLVTLLEVRDRAGIGALLREWEQVTVKTWGVEHLYEPTPFPVELGAGN